MKLIDFLKPEDLFHPKVFYEGEWLLGGELDTHKALDDYLLMNAKMVNGENAYQKFLEKHYYGPLTNILDSKSLAHNFFPKIALTVDKTKGKRTTRFALSMFIYQQILGLFYSEKAMSEFVKSIEGVEEQNDWLPSLKQLLKDDRKIYFDVRNNGASSSHYQEVYQLYKEYVAHFQSKMGFQEFLEGKISGSTKMIVSIRYYQNLFQKEISIEELLEAFDYDTLLLVAAKSALDCCKVTESRENKVDNCAGYIKLYLDAVERLRAVVPNYNCTMQVLDVSGKKKILKIEDIKTEYESLLSRHPEFSFIMLDDDEMSTLLRREGIEEETIQNFDYSSQSNHDTLQAILTKLKASRELAAEWEFIQKGTVEAETTMHKPSLNSTQVLSEDERIRRMIIGREYLENSAYVYKIYGKNKFEGYIGYIYPNGAVIFEKYYENIITKKVASAAATYVMSLDNFMEMSKLSKTEIIRIIQRDSTANVRRIFHHEDMNRWKSAISMVIEGSDYTEEVIHYIDSLVANRDLQKSEVKS